MNQYNKTCRFNKVLVPQCSSPQKETITTYENNKVPTTGCFVGSTKILLSDGSYKNIADINVGDHVINMLGKSVKVLNKLNKGFKETIVIKNQSFYRKTYVTEDHKFYIGDLSELSNSSLQPSKINYYLDIKKSNKNRYKWKKINEYEQGKSFILMPKDIDWDLPNELVGFEEISYFSLGYIITMYLSNSRNYLFDGFINVQIDDRILGMFIDVLNNLTQGDIKYKIAKNNHDGKSFTKVSFKFEKLEEVLTEIENNNRTLPTMYRCTNKDFLKGLVDGMMNTNPNKGKIENVSNIELCCWLSIVLNKYNQISNDDGNYIVEKQSSNNKTTNFTYSRLDEIEKGKYLEVWDIEVDCNTHSFVADNMIVHNSSC